MDIVTLSHRVGRIAGMLAAYINRTPGCDDRLDAAAAELTDISHELGAVADGPPIAEPPPAPPPAEPAPAVEDPAH